MKKSEWGAGVYEEFMETAMDSYDFVTCIRENGTYYGNGGAKCRKGAEATTQEKKTKGSRDFEKGGTGGGEVPGSANIAAFNKKIDRANEALKNDPTDELAQFAKAEAKRKLKPILESQKMVDGVVRDVPKGTEVSMSQFTMGGLQTKFVTPGGNVVETFLNKRDFSFTVNGKFDAGAADGNRAEQLAISRQVQRVFNAQLKNAPEGLILETSAWKDDGRGASRQRAYERVGFAKPTPGGGMYGQIINGKLVPVNPSQVEDTSLLITFRENEYSFSEEAKKEEDAWFEIVFGVSPEEGGENFAESYDFVTCIRENGTYYGNGGAKCRKGTEATKRDLAKEKKKAKAGDKQAAKNVAKMEKSGVAGPAPKAKKAAAPAPEAPKKEGAYTPRDAKGKTGVKPKVNEDMFKNKSSSFDAKTMDERIARVKANKNYTAAHRKELLARLEKEKSQIAANMKFAEDVGKNLPKGTKLEVTGTGTVKITTKTKAGDTVTSTYSPRMGYEFRVNGNLDTGGAKSGIQAAQATRVQFDALVKALPTGHIMKTSAYTDDGNGAARQKAYEKVGFSKGKPGKDLFAVKQADGSVAPGKSGKAGLDKQKAQDKAGEMWFKEPEDMDKVWYTILTGEDFKG